MEEPSGPGGRQSSIGVISFSLRLTGADARGITARMCRWLRLVPLLCLGALVAGCTHSGSPHATSSTASPTPVRLPSVEVHRIQADLVSGDPRRIREALDVPPGRRLDPAFLRQMHGLEITFQVSTAVTAGPNQVALDARVTSPDGRKMTWRVTLDHVDGRYLVADTRPIQK